MTETVALKAGGSIDLSLYRKSWLGLLPTNEKATESGIIKQSAMAISFTAWSGIDHA
jgi:hypothetical protein